MAVIFFKKRNLTNQNIKVRKRKDWRQKQWHTRLRERPTAASRLGVRFL